MALEATWGTLSPTNRCEKCIGLTIDCLRDQDVRHHASLADLKRSALSGCDLCHLFWRRLETDCQANAIETHLNGKVFASRTRTDTSILLRGEFHDMDTLEARMSARFGTNRDKILIWSGYESDQNVGTEVYSNLSVFALADTLASQYLAPNINLSYSSPVATANAFLGTTNWWLDRCRGHKRCNEPKRRIMPKRLIDLGKPNERNSPYLSINHDPSETHYVALSYSWGDGKRHAVHLSKATLQKLCEGINEQNLTKTHREALEVTRGLGFRYIWIDALCIMQGKDEESRADFSDEVQRLPATYGNAELTIVTGRSDHSDKGFLAVEKQPAVMPCALAYSRPKDYGLTLEYLGNCYIGFPRDQSVGPVALRAWCFQEAVLSRRMAVFGVEQMIFVCQEKTEYEDGYEIFYKWGANNRFILDNQQNLNPKATASELTDLLLKRWYELTQEYSRRNLFDPTDFFPALTGTTQHYEKNLGCKYLGGIWEIDLVRGLLWCTRLMVRGPYSNIPLTRPVKMLKNGTHKVVKRAPSWSWASVRGPIIQVSSIRPRTWITYGDKRLWKCRPWDSNEGMWSLNPWSGKDIEKTECVLQVCGVLKQVVCLEVSMRSFDIKTKAFMSKMKRHGVPLGVENGSLTEPVAIGIFDYQDEKLSIMTCYCLQLVAGEGLMLREGEDGHFQRLGIFFVQDDSWFEGGIEADITLG